VDETTVKSALAGLIARVETLEAENAKLTALNTECGATVRKLLERVENLQAVNAELTVKLKPARSNGAPAKPGVSYRKRPAVLRGRTVQSNVGCGPLYITLNEDETGKPFEVFFKLGKSGSCQQSYLEALGVAMSVGLRYGADPQKFIDKFEGMRCPNPKMRNAEGPTTLSCADGISQGLAKALALALPGTDPQIAHEAGVVAVAEPQFPYPIDDKIESDLNAKSIDLIGRSGFTNGRSNGTTSGHTENGDGEINVRRAMQTGVGMCPKCSGPLISQGGCIQCLQQCGYVGKCS
jgi:ribonucleoside-diphosphate reductase alpha chain